MVKDLAGRRIVVTGASSGIGRCFAALAGRAGARVLLAARSTQEVEELSLVIRAGGGTAVPITCDVTSDADRRRLIEEAVVQFGGIDVLVNNAGVAGFGHFADSNEALLRRIMEVNFFAPAELIRLAIPHLTEGSNPAIVNVASMCGRRGLPAWSEYSASKFALCGLTEALRGEMARFEIGVVLIVPGLTRSAFPKHLLRNEGRLKIDFQKGMSPELVAEGILKALQRLRSEVVLGREARWLLLANRFFPGFVDRMIARQVRMLYS